MTAVRELRTDPLDGFSVPRELEAKSPPECRGSSRDGVRLMTAGRDGIRHRSFVDLADELVQGDLLVINNSATLPASVVVDESNVINFSTLQPGGYVVVEPRLRSAHASLRNERAGPGLIRLPGGAIIDLRAPFPVGSASRRLWLVETDLGRIGLHDYLKQWGRPIRYPHLDAPYPLRFFQTVFASVPGSAEMPSAGRPFSGEILAALAAKGVSIAPITLHTGVSSLESGEPPCPEWFQISRETAELVNHTRRIGGKVIAVGTTVMRALESSADDIGQVHPVSTWTDRVITGGDPIMVADGLITGWHEPESSHLDMLKALAGRTVVEEAYVAALDSGYLWHEFGDSLLLLPDRA